MNNKDLPAFPVVFDTHFHTKGLSTNEDICKRIEGLTKRELISATIKFEDIDITPDYAQAISGIPYPTDSKDYVAWFKYWNAIEAFMRVSKADALLTELSKAENDLP